MSWQPLAELAGRVQSGSKTARSLLEQSLAAITDNHELNAVLAHNEQATADADRIDRQVAAGEQVGRLAGIPFLAKDNFLTRNLETTAGSTILKGYLPPYTATAIERLLAEGAVLVGKTNLDAFGHGTSTENSDFGPTKNPHDHSRVPGGSSGGSAAAVAAGLVPFALGTDTGGSSRHPASCCGVVGYKPTYGLISRYGVIAMASSTDTIGSLTNSVRDTALLLDIMSGRDPKDATTIERDTQSYLVEPTDLRGKTFGLIKEWMGEALSQDVRAAIDKAVKKLRTAGAEVREVSIPSLELALAVYYIVVPAEISSNLSRYDGIRYGHSQDGATLDEVYERTRSLGFNAENKRRIMMGTYVLSSGYYDAYYKRAQTVRTLLVQEFNKAFEGFDALIGPTSPNTAFKFGENTGDPLQMYLEDIMTVGVNLAGVPAATLPAGKQSGLPVGIQVITPQRTDRTLLSLASGIEDAMGYQP